MRAKRIAEQITDKHGLDPSTILLIIQILQALWEVWQACHFRSFTEQEFKVSTRLVTRCIMGRLKFRLYGQKILNELYELRGQYGTDEFRNIKFG